MNQGKKVDYSSVTPATSMDPDSNKLPETFANQMPTADMPAHDNSPRADPDKTVPGSEAATGVDEAEQAATKKKRSLGK